MENHGKYKNVWLLDSDRECDRVWGNKDTSGMCPIELVEKKATSPIEFFEKKAASPIEFFEKKADCTISPVEKGVDCPIEFGVDPSTNETGRADDKNRLLGIMGGEESSSTLDGKENLDASCASKEEGTPIIKPTGNEVAFGTGCQNQTDYSDLANYNIQPVRKIVYLNRFGKELKSREEIECYICSEDFATSKFIILTKDVKKITTVIGEKFSAAWLNCEVKNVAKIVENRFRHSTRKIPTVRCFVDYGWQKIDGQWVYAHDSLQTQNDIIFQTSMTLPSYEWTRERIGQIFLDAYHLYEGEAEIGTMLAFSMMGVLYRLFHDAGYAPHFILFINGKTGTMKTTLSKILFGQLSDEVHRDIPRRIDADTVASFERGIVLSGRDTVTLIDDYAPPKTARQKLCNEEKLEAIIRMIGDRSTKSRSNIGLDDCRGEGIEGAVVLTGELIGKGLSSNLRCLYCGLQREKVNVNQVSVFQQEPYRYTTLIRHFSYYAAENWTRIREYIQGTFQPEREITGQQLTERRLVDSAVVLRLICEIIRKFLVQYCFASVVEADAVTEKMKDGILRMAVMSEQISKEETFGVRIAKMIDQLVQGGELVMIDRKPNEADIGKIDGFYNKNFYYFVPENLFGEVKKIFCMTNVFFPLDLDEMVKTLYEEGLIMASSNGNNKKTYYARILIGNKKRNFLKVNAKILQKMIEDEEQ